MKPMTSRERILAALTRQPVDKIPFTPLIDPYTIKDLPEEITGPRIDGGMDPLRMAHTGRGLKCDLMIRHVPATRALRTVTPHLQSLGGFDPSIELKSEFKDGHFVEIMDTPVGGLTGTWKFTERVGIIPHPVKHFVNNYEELKIFHYAVERMDPNPPELAGEEFIRVDREIGDDGIATASISNTPLMFLIEMVWGLENTYYLLADYRDEVEDIMRKLHLSLRRYVEVLADCPARVIIQYENTSSTLLSPAVFRRYCLPLLNEYAGILRAAGKIYLVHMCGKLRAFVSDIAGAEFAGITDIPPPPTGDLPLDEAAGSLPGKVVVGGISPTTFINPDPAVVETEISGLIERIKPFPGVLLGSADTTPRGTPVENFHLIRSLVDRLGAYE